MNRQQMTDLMSPANRFPWDRASEAALTEADALDPTDHSGRAEYIREVADSVRDHRHGQRDPRQ